MWLGAAHRLGVPSLAVQHGVIYPNNPDYYRPAHPGLVRPDVTCVYGSYERELLIEGGHYDPATVVVTGSPRVHPDEAPIDVSPDDGVDLRRELGVADTDRLLVVSAARNPVGDEMHSVSMVARLLDGPLPGIHVVVKLHPEEATGEHYERLLAGLAAAGGYPPVRDQHHPGRRPVPAAAGGRRAPRPVLDGPDRRRPDRDAKHGRGRPGLRGHHRLRRGRRRRARPVGRRRARVHGRAGDPEPGRRGRGSWRSTTGAGDAIGRIARAITEMTPRGTAGGRGMTRTVAIIQARTGSTRLPGKVLLPLLSEPLLVHVVRRVARASRVDAVVVATTTMAGDDAIVELGSEAGWLLSRGSEMDLLERYLEAARAYGAERVVRITSDCPLIDPQVIDEVVAALDAADADYASNTLEPRTFPRGLDVEAMTMDALETAGRDDRDPASREHATPYLYRHPERFRLAAVRLSEDLSGHRWTVDTPEDYELVRRIYDRLGRDDFGWREALAVVEANPGWSDLNRHVEQKVVPGA